MDKPGDNKREELDFDPRHVETFLTKIYADRDAAISEIRDYADKEIAKIRKEAFRNTHDLARKTIRTTRELEAQERDRYIYKVKAELKREHWKVLAELRQQVLEKARTTFESAWKDPQQQWTWCRSWIATATGLARGQDLEIRLGTGGSKKVLSKIEQMLKGYDGKYTLEIDKAKPAGIVISWPDHYLDGTLMSHCQEVSNEVVDQLAQTLSPGGPGEEPG